MGRQKDDDGGPLRTDRTRVRRQGRLLSVRRRQGDDTDPHQIHGYRPQIPPRQRPAAGIPDRSGANVHGRIHNPGAAGTFLQSMPRDRYLLLQMHEMLSYLNQQGVITILVLGQHGVVSEGRSEVDSSQPSDTIVEFRDFEAQGSIHNGLSIAKSRANPLAASIREFRLEPTGVKIGESSMDFERVLSRLPNYRGASH